MLITIYPPQHYPMVTISIDRGGTFTDVIATENQKEIVFKLLSVDPANYKDAPTEGIRRVLEHFRNRKIPKSEKLVLNDVESIRMGTTVATNALLERKGDRVLLLVTKGFKDILRIGQQARPNIFDLKILKYDLLFERVIEVDERLKFSDDGLIDIEKSPDYDQVEKDLQEGYDSGIRSVAIAFLHSYLYPDHELKVAELARKVGFPNISVSSQLQPMIKLVSRTNSATADAYLSPIISRYLKTIAEGFEGGLDVLDKKLFFMQSDGGLTSAHKFSGLRAILSGPAGGVVGHARTTFIGDKPVLGFDMGGTSTDVSRYNGKFDHVFETKTAEVDIQAPQLLIETVAAGGGSILNFENGLFKVGPESASAHPGPTCYRKGGPLTVTDANLLLGKIDVETFPHIFGPNENESLDLEGVCRAFTELAIEISKQTSKKMSAETVAQGFLDVANETMCRPIRKLTEGKGFNASDHVLASFGGAGGQHAVSIARILGISDVVIHKYSSLLSAYGIALANVVADVQLPCSSLLSENEMATLHAKLDELSVKSIDDLVNQGFKDKENIYIERFLNCVYDGSDNSKMVRQSGDGNCANFRESFIKSHQQEFGFTLKRDIYVTDVRVRAVYKPQNVNESELLPLYKEDHVTPYEKQCSGRKQKIFFGNEWKECPLFKLSELPHNCKIEGPCMILDNTQTIVIEPNSSAIILPNHILISVGNKKKSTNTAAQSHVDPIQLSVFGNRFMSIAEQMGQALQKTAISVNIKERLDFSCAIFDPEGGLVANAPHIPVHLGSMSSQVQQQKQMWEGKLQEGDVLVANHPAYGGSHLPDITVITPVFAQPVTGSPEIIFWVASRGHHSDIGGITAGSMPPFSHHLWEEGACIKGFKIVSQGKFDLDGIVDLLYTQPAKYPNCSGSRSLNDSVSDLKAQIAANNKGIQLIHDLANENSLQVVQKYMKAIQKNAENAVRKLLTNVGEQTGYPYTLKATEYLDDGSPISVQIIINPNDGSAVFDFNGTGPQIYGNLNAPMAITHSAILYVLRSLISQDIPLNQGCLTPLEIKIPNLSLLSPGPEQATVGGNVETSQRVVDVLLKAFKAVAGSQGTCNNFSFGCEKFGYYETIGGGAGAGPNFHGTSGVQVHMTNTRATDPEIMEKRYPVILREFGIRTGSGGKGKFNGGDGIIKDIEFRHPVQVSILSERRSMSPYGLFGGEEGSKGVNYMISNGVLTSLGGKNTVEVNVGDHIVIQTPGGGGYGSASSGLAQGP